VLLPIGEKKLVMAVCGSGDGDFRSLMYIRDCSISSPPSLQPVEILAAGALEGGREGNGLESGQVSEGADI